MSQTFPPKADPAPQRGETRLELLLAGLAPIRASGAFVFVSAPRGDVDARARLMALHPLMLFEEPEGPSAILSAEIAKAAGYAEEPRFAMITLTVHSSLEAVGMTAAVAAALTERAIPANVVAATRHDHVFVPLAHAEDAMAAIEALASTARAGA